MTHTTPPGSDDEAGARLRRDRPPEGHDLDGQLHLAHLQQQLAGEAPGPIAFRQWDVERRLGKGGMGAVYLARHRQLDRKVALKVLTRRSEADPAVHETLLVREARALTTIQHGNVVRVHQVDTSAEPTVIEMEYIDGPTLRTWQVGRDWREVVEAYAGAGDGLAALHDAKLVHRDVKPDNLLRGSDGHVKVVDLGLAVAAPEARAAALHDIATSGTFAGTPGYMAPETIAESRADATSDQFGLAASLFEAVYGVAPFRGDTPEDLATAFRAGRPLFPLDAPARPRWLREALARALAFNPDRRYPTVASFTQALRSGLGRRRRWLLRALLTAALTVPAAFAWSAKPSPPDPCAGAGEPFTSIWTPAARALLAQQAAQGPPQLARSLDLLFSTFDVRTVALADTRIRLCAAERSLDPDDTSRIAELDLNARQHACLEHARRNLAALVASLPGVGDSLAPGYAEATTMVEAQPTCDDRQQFSHWPLPSQGEDRDRDADLADALAHAAALEAASHHDEAEQLARRIVRSSSEQHPLRHAEALYRLGHILGMQRSTDVAITALDEARNAAFAAGYDELMCQAVAFQAKVSANVRLDAATSARELGLAEACLQRTGARSILLRADLLEARGLLALAAGDSGAAIRWHREALELRQYHLDEHHDTTKSLQNLANALAAAGNTTEARQRFHEALGLRERLSGPDHLEVANILFDLGNFLAAVDPDQAPPVLERAAAIYSRTPGVLRAAQAKIHLLLAIPLLDAVPVSASNREAATTHIRQARAILEEDQTLDPTHPTRASLLQAEGLLALRRGDFRGSRQAYARATGLRRRHDPLSRDVLASILMEIEPAYGLGDHASIARHALDEGQPLIEEIRAHGLLAWYVGDSLIRQSAPAEAALYFQTALDAYAEQSDAGSVAELHWQLAQALALTPIRIEEAHDHATKSLAYHQAANDSEKAATISRWLKHFASSPRPNQSRP